VSQGIERSRNMKHRRILLRSIRENVEELTGEAVDLESTAAKTKAPSSSSPVVTPVTTMTIGPLTIYPGRYQISVGDQPIDLTPTEFDLLLYLAAHRGRVVPCSELVREVRGYTLEEHEAREVIRPHISNLRRKLKASGQNPNIIVNVRGIGYRLAETS
jgi:two-component system alkaline phosphatase synthesis response regulator PhoP